MCALLGMMSCGGNKNAAGRADETAAERTVEQAVLADIAGEWILKAVNGQDMPDGMERTPFLAFDVEEMRVYGFASCNLVNGAIQQEEGQPASLRMPQMVSTMMAGPHLELEQEVLKATEQVTSFALNEQKDVLTLCDAEGKELLRLQKNTGEKLGH